MDTWKLAYLRMEEAVKIANKERLIYQAIAANKHARGKQRLNILARVQALKGLILCYGESLYCRTLGLIFSRPD